MKNLSIILITLFFQMSVLFSAVENNRQQNNFAQYREKVTMIIKSLKIELKKIHLIFSSIKSKSDLISKAAVLTSSIKNALRISSKILGMNKKLNTADREAFMKWVREQDTELQKLIKNTFIEKTRVTNLPGCIPVIAGIDNEMQLYGRSLRY